MNGVTHCVHGLEHNIASMSICSKLIYKFNAISTKITAIFCIYRQDNSKIYKWESKGNRTAKTMLKDKEKVGWNNIPNFKIYVGYTNQDSVYWWTDRHMFWRNRTENYK